MAVIFSKVDAINIVTRRIESKGESSSNLVYISMTDSMLASQQKLTDLTSKFDGRTPIRIHFLDNSSKVFLVDYNTTVKDVVIMVLEKFAVNNMKDIFTYFGLFEARNGGTIDGGALNMETSVTSVVQNWSTLSVEKTAKFLFMIRLHMPCAMGLQHKDVVAFRMGKGTHGIDDAAYIEAAELTDSACLHLQFIQAVYNVITGRYPTTKEEALSLGAIHFLFKFGSFSPTSHQPGFLGNRIVELIPIKHLKSGSEATIEDWEQLLLQRVISHSSSLPELVLDPPSSSSSSEEEDEEEEDGSATDTATTTTTTTATATATVKDPIPSSSYARNGHIITPERQYMETVYKMSCYGMTLFKCSQKSTRKLPETLFVGLHRMGITLLDKGKTSLRDFSIEEIFRWGFKPKQLFYFEIDADNDLLTGSLDFETEDGMIMSDLLTDYAMAFLKEREAEQRRLAQIKTGNTEGMQIGEDMDKIMSMAHETVSTDDVVLTNGDEEISIALGGADESPADAASPSIGKKFKRLSMKNKVESSLKGTGSGVSAQEHTAATKLQCLFRGYSLRREWSMEEAAITIQTIYRGYRGRVLIGKMIEAMFANGTITLNQDE